MQRRELLALAVLGGAFAVAPASACRAPKAKDRQAYSTVIHRLFAAWFARDYANFRKAFLDPEVDEPFASRAVFDDNFNDEKHRTVGGVMFNGPSAIVQVITVQPGFSEQGICGGYGWGDLVLVKFFPGLNTPVVWELRYIDGDILAEAELPTPPPKPSKG